MTDESSLTTCAGALEWLAERCGGELPEAAAAALDAHLLDCAECAEAAAEMEEGYALLEGLVTAEMARPVPPLDDAGLQAGLQAALGSSARPEREVRRRVVSWRQLGRAAALLLAAVGLAALFGTEIQVRGGTLRVAFALPGSSAETPAAPGVEFPELDRSVDLAVGRVVEQRLARALSPVRDDSELRKAVDAGLRPHLEDLAHWFVDVDRRRDEDLEFLADWLDRRRQDDASTLARQLLDTREKLEDTRQRQDHLLDALTPGAVPRDLPVRFEPR